MKELKLKIKEDIKLLSDEKKASFEKVSKSLFENPELAFEEFKSQKALCNLLEENGFDVTKGVGGLETSFEAVYSNGTGGKTVAFLAEYDALPGMGHACGHNIIGTSSVGAGIILKEVIKKYDIEGTVKVFGTPAEERVGGKITMIREGVFKDVDAALILHPCDASIPDDISFAQVNLKFDFSGKASHAAAYPWEGRSALSGVIALFNSVNSMRLHLKDYARVHGIITDGGSIHNIIPEKSIAIFNVRALSIEYLNEICDMLKDCAKGAAISTGTSVEVIQLDEIYKEIKNDSRLVNIVRENFEVLGEDYIERDLTQGIGSTDTGNLTHEIPAIQAYIKLKENTATHTEEFAVAAGGEEGKIALIKAIKVLAMCGVDVLYSK
ncbi:MULTISPECIES: M20 family metallopeptidase [unclassified Clostridioides]|uniref:M20 family metallopeptidase n=1 Tax=unclassified Clostridioides TaxID=2635829 RepID=UPI001D0CA1A7|nr:M20 family metallopeptidase [Clostridioides sp. ES-S-0001-02]MCC0656707.1 M20 family metallopeptidase [Clostridioides sp. ES-S-0123-01]MCC0672098.1 M20 family metallopeptidase [Clostridioides sp. ES-S-0145-01]MCC0681417.1 M20 family metallopeptidase [Clostridioides sp. ES-S-0005-03]MCC0695605.1 M20 family metallopeptidase [Clostridioides sp. ES-S-0048-02]MCC0705801.1 M20 family metallopeptidase [Clostridioides sp. ES-S-0190-01]MCC0762322.1 M20 family metallopeptidase [Clostridioides sp. ES